MRSSLSPCYGQYLTTFLESNVDRLVAIWQALNKDAWWKSSDVRNRAGKLIKNVTPQDDLLPFHRK